MTDQWLPESQSPDRITVLCRTGANYYHAARLDGKWFTDAMREVHPEEYYHHIPTLADLLSVMKPA